MHESSRPISVFVHFCDFCGHLSKVVFSMGLIINFHALKLTDGVSRLILPGANLE